MIAVVTRVEMKMGGVVTIEGMLLQEEINRRKKLMKKGLKLFAPDVNVFE